MAISKRSRATVLVTIVAGLGIALAGCTTPTPATSGDTGSGDALGTPNAASGTPVSFATLDVASGPVTFPEVLAAEQAAVQYVNAYLGGIGGPPIELKSCETDGTPATSQRCANQLLDGKPVAVIGGADVGSPGAIPV